MSDLKFPPPPKKTIHHIPLTKKPYPVIHQLPADHFPTLLPLCSSNLSKLTIPHLYPRFSMQTTCFYIQNFFLFVDNRLYLHVIQLPLLADTLVLAVVPVICERQHVHGPVSALRCLEVPVANLLCHIPDKVIPVSGQAIEYPPSSCFTNSRSNYVPDSFISRLALPFVPAWIWRPPGHTSESVAD